MNDLDTKPSAISAEISEEHEAFTRQRIIREAGLFVDDPESIPGRHHPIPAGIEPVRLLKDYDTSRTTGRKVRCSACAHQQPHNRGFVAEMPDGRPALIGINCGEKHFGDGAWQRMNADLRREQDDVYYAARVHPALQQIQTSYERAVGLKGAIRSFEGQWKQMRQNVPELFKKLDVACRRNEGALVRHVTRMVPSIGRDGRLTHREQVENVSFGAVPDPGAFIARSALHDLDAAIGTLRTAKLKLESSADTRPRRDAFAALARGKRLVEDVAAQMRGYVLNSSGEWWASAVRFCLAEGTMTRLNLTHRTLRGSNDGWTAFDVTIPRLSPSDLANVDALLGEWPGGA
ncbi:hypothetical protein C8J46_10954 [Sphingomonas sp. PP-F2F-A104-K0414]|uniref:hypothetical protein n=1 Tax=Sphingomonas sp. PP-F2F-A104-K0414 TaxID=2135661 RepID=UPI00104ED11E|nr:hypothetical protein [Sphingomonas sp. PP-F2F-A104-K0414]TCP96359.1 hypothetical protein C8J46_10954 [Sphingomonas sp. PP-F2F-A104-K0414]